MAGSLNKVMLIGNIGKDPEIRSTQGGSRIANLSLATSESWKDKHSGERKERTEWHRVVVFNDGLVGVIEKYVKKGSKLYIEGQLQTRKWTDNSGAERYSTEVVLQPYKGQLTLLDAAKGGSSSGTERPYSQRHEDAGGYEERQASGAYTTDLDDDIPF